MRTPKSPSYKSARGKSRMSGGVGFNFETVAPPEPEPSLSREQYQELCDAWNRDNSIGSHVVYNNQIQTTTKSIAFVAYAPPFVAIIRIAGIDGLVRLEDLQVKETHGRGI